MILFHLKSAFAGLRNNKLFTILNISGFAIGLTACMILGLYIYKEYTVDTCYPNYRNIYRLIDAKKNLAVMDYDIAAELKEQFPEIKQAVPLHYLKWGGSAAFIRSIKSNESVSFERIMSTSNDFFKLFTVKTIAGNATKPFADGNSIVLTRSLSEKLFGKTDVLGEQIDVMNMMNLTVSAVVDNLPENSSMSPDFFVNGDADPNMRMTTMCKNNICHNPLSIYIELSSSANPELTLKKINDAFPANKSETDSISFQPMTDIYLNNTIEWNNNDSGNRTWIMIFLGISIVILLLSVFNYINFSLSRQLSTLRQLGIRMTNGASTSQLRILYLTEITLTVLIGFLLALIIVKPSLPFASSLLDSNLHFNQLFSPLLLSIIMGILVIIIIIASLAPFYIISRFDIQSFLGKKNVRFGKQRVKYTLTVIQMAASIALLAGLFTINQQLKFMQHADLGFDKEHLLRLNFNKDLPGESLKQEIDQCPFVKSSTLSLGTPGDMIYSMGISEKDDSGNDLSLSLGCIFTDKHFLETMGVQLVSGREFVDSDFNNACLLNEEAIRQAGWKTYEGKKVNNNGNYNIIGVVKDFNVSSLHNNVNPVCILFSDKTNYNNLSIRLESSDLVQQMDGIEKIWKKTFNQTPFNYSFYDELFDAFYRKERQQAQAIGVFSIIALIITCMGLLGQLFQACLVRIKEIGIRKINGASIIEIIILLNKSFIKGIIVSFIIAVPLSYYMMEKWLGNFAYKTSLYWWIFVLAGLVTLIISVITVSWQSWRAASANPVNAIKNE